MVQEVQDAREGEAGLVNWSLHLEDPRVLRVLGFWGFWSFGVFGFCGFGGLGVWGFWGFWGCEASGFEV